MSDTKKSTRKSSKCSQPKIRSDKKITSKRESSYNLKQRLRHYSDYDDNYEPLDNCEESQGKIHDVSLKRRFEEVSNEFIKKQKISEFKLNPNVIDITGTSQFDKFKDYWFLYIIRVYDSDEDK
jgi:hypothetical protein